MKIVQKCGPCGGELTIESDDWRSMVNEVAAWRTNHPCMTSDEDGRVGTGFAATSIGRREREAYGHIEPDVRA